MHRRLLGRGTGGLWPLPLLMLSAIGAWGWLLHGLAPAMAQPIGSMWALCAAALPLFLVMVLWSVWLLRLAHKVGTRSDQQGQSMGASPPKASELHGMSDDVNCQRMQTLQERQGQQRFIENAAHQLRTPLTALQSQVEAWALRVEAAPAQTMTISAQQMEPLRRAVRRTTQLANQLLVLSRVDSGLERAAEMRSVDLPSLCEALLESFLDRALAKNIDFGLEAHAVQVTGHEWLLRELISNLLDNAIKYTAVGGQVTLRCGRRSDTGRGHFAYVEVEDNGPGVDRSEYTRITQRFYRAKESDVEGTGLGLAIASEIAASHGALLNFSQGAQQQGLQVTLEFCAGQRGEYS